MKSRAIFVTFIFTLILMYAVTIYYTNSGYSNLRSEDIIDDRLIENIENINKTGEKVFFVETQNTTEHKITTRQACCIESAGMNSK